MRLKSEALANQLRGEIAPVYLFSGDEPLLLDELADQARSAFRKKGFDERTVLTVGSGFRWDELNAEGSALSLFAEKKVVDLRLPTGKPGRDGGKALTEWCETPPNDKVLLIISGKLDGSAQKSKWYKSIEQCGITVQVWPVEIRQMPGWIMQRMRSAGLEATAAATELIAERVEGNLLAALQEIEKLTLLVEPGTSVDEQMVVSLVANSARFNVFKFSDALLAGERARALCILHGLREEGAAIQVVLWSVIRDLRELAAMAVEQNPSAHQPLEYNPMWRKRQPMFTATLNRLGEKRVIALVRQLGLIERAGKGMHDGDPWSGLEDFVVRATIA